MDMNQQQAILHYDKLAGIYDSISNWYYVKARQYAIEELDIQKGQTIINLPCGTGVNFKLFQKQLENTGRVIGIDLSSGMLDQAKRKIRDQIIACAPHNF
ncbi:methyltransferase domain-containing protein [Sporosarcina sp. CAU 1771]